MSLSHSQGSREGFSEGNLWTKARTRKEHQLGPGKPEDREPRGCVRKEDRQ